MFVIKSLLLQGLSRGFTIHSIQGFVSTIFLVEYPHKLLLLDSGCASDVARVKSFITERLKRPMADLRLVVVTHCHPDHQGGAHLYSKDHGIKIAAPSNINTWYDGILGVVQHRLDISLGYYVKACQRFGFLMALPLLPMLFMAAWLPYWSYYPRCLRFDHPLHDGQTLPGFDEWNVIAIPGHTSHMVSLYHKPSKTLYTSDLMVQPKPGGKFRMPLPVNFPSLMHTTLSWLQREVLVETLLLAHGGEQAVNAFPAVVSKLQGQLQNDTRSLLVSKIISLPTRETRRVNAELCGGRAWTHPR
mmetsp:Transcript_115327/g.200811  ORF Transcript_115327/g.200811 Transcript_115327/m.200811 type:complete len:302 (-) Transcript_115327:123-1028(-)